MKKIICAMSGGVDSSVAAALLKKGGFDVVGVFMRLADLPSFKKREKRAKKVAKILKIPFHVFNFEKEFKKKIIDYFLDEYKKGKTPNPCVVCNEKIKFRLLLKKVSLLGGNCVATGHYARKQETRNKKQETRYRLLKGKDKEKDQSYFLWMLNQKQLKRVLFPVGDYTKAKVRKIARKLKLPVSDIPESMEICFIQTTINNFLKKHLKERSGKIVNTKGKIIGKHWGLWFYTIGQRKGIKLPGGPYYVLEKKTRQNILIVTRNEKDLYKKELRLKEVNWISGKVPRLPLRVKAKIRYRHTPTLATVRRSLGSKAYGVKFKVAQRTITPGQSVVFFKGQEVLGGGIIF
jgi:tRNA-specific 2-thiouridylase